MKHDNVTVKQLFTMAIDREKNVVYLIPNPPRADGKRVAISMMKGEFIEQGQTDYVPLRNWRNVMTRLFEGLNRFNEAPPPHQSVSWTGPGGSDDG